MNGQNDEGTILLTPVIEGERVALYVNRTMNDPVDLNLTAMVNENGSFDLLVSGSRDWPALSLIRESFVEFKRVIIELIPGGTSFEVIESELVSYFPRNDNFIFFIDVRYVEWSLPGTVGDFVDALEGEINKISGGYSFTLLASDYSHGTFTIKNAKPERNVIQSGDDIFMMVSQAEINVIKDIKSQYDAGMVSMTFTFPLEVRSACEQYLLYFSEFLRDSGQSVISNINHSGEDTLFTIIPSEKDQALKDIHEALGIFLNLPSVVEAYGLSRHTSAIEIQKLQSNIGFLQAQLGLARITMLQQNQALELKDTIISQQYRALEQSILHGKIMIDSAKEEDGEDIIEGIVAVKKYEIGPVEIDFPNIFKQIKKIFDKD